MQDSQQPERKTTAQRDPDTVRNLRQVVHQLYRKGYALGYTKQQIDGFLEGANFQLSEKMHSRLEEKEMRYSIAEEKLKQWRMDRISKGMKPTDEEVEAERKRRYEAADLAIMTRERDLYMTEIARLQNETTGTGLAVLLKRHEHFEAIRLPPGGL